MATKVLVPLLGEGVEEVTIIKWLNRKVTRSTSWSRFLR